MSGAEKFAQLTRDRDGAGLHRLLRSRSLQSGGRLSGHPIAAELGRALQAGDTETGLEAWCSVLKQWCDQYASEDAADWMVGPLLELGAAPRRLAAKLDSEEEQERHRRKLVEVLRTLFQRLHRDNSKFEGCLVVCCELLRLYFALGQASQCSFLLSALNQSRARGGKIDLKSLPKALGVTFAFLCGKHCVMDGNVVEAEEKLGWAFSHCPPKEGGNRRRILLYLVPCRLRLGRYPSKALLDENGLHGLAAIAAAVSRGDVRGFEKELEKQEEELIMTGTYLVVEKLKLVAFQNLCKRVYDFQAAGFDRQGKSDSRHKQDLRPFHRALDWQDDCDEDETTCILANLIYIGAIRGYMSDEHQKIVFSKDVAFPVPAIWCSKA